MSKNSTKLKAAKRLIEAQKKLISYDDQVRRSKQEQQAARSKLLQEVKLHTAEYEEAVIQDDFFLED